MLIEAFQHFSYFFIAGMSVCNHEIKVLSRSSFQMSVFLISCRMHWFVVRIHRPFSLICIHIQCNLKRIDCALSDEKFLKK